MPSLAGVGQAVSGAYIGRTAFALGVESEALDMKNDIAMMKNAIRERN